MEGMAEGIDEGAYCPTRNRRHPTNLEKEVDAVRG